MFLVQFCVFKTKFMHFTKEWSPFHDFGWKLMNSWKCLICLYFPRFFNCGGGVGSPVAASKCIFSSTWCRAAHFCENDMEFLVNHKFLPRMMVSTWLCCNSVLFTWKSMILQRNDTDFMNSDGKWWDPGNAKFHCNSLGFSMVRDVIPSRLLKILQESREHTEIDENLMKLLIFHDKSSGMCKIHSRFNVLMMLMRKVWISSKFMILIAKMVPSGSQGGYMIKNATPQGGELVKHVTAQGGGLGRVS